MSQISRTPLNRFIIYGRSLGPKPYFSKFCVLSALRFLIHRVIIKTKWFIKNFYSQLSFFTLQRLQTLHFTMILKIWTLNFFLSRTLNMVKSIFLSVYVLLFNFAPVNQHHKVPLPSSPTFIWKVNNEERHERDDTRWNITTYTLKYIKENNNTRMSFFPCSLTRNHNNMEKTHRMKRIKLFILNF